MRRRCIGRSGLKEKGRERQELRDPRNAKEGDRGRWTVTEWREERAMDKLRGRVQ